MNRFPKESVVPDQRLGGVGADRIEQLLELIPSILEDVSEIRSILSDRSRKDYMTVEEFASLVRRAPYTVRTWIKDHRVDAIRVSGTGPRGRLLIARSEVDKVICAGLGGRMQGDVSR